MRATILLDVSTINEALSLQVTQLCYVIYYTWNKHPLNQTNLTAGPFLPKISTENFGGQISGPKILAVTSTYPVVDFPPSDLYHQLVPLPILWWQLKSVLSVTTILAQLIYSISLGQYCQAIDLCYAAMALVVT